MSWMEVVYAYRGYAGSTPMLLALLLLAVIGLWRTRERTRLVLPLALMLLPVVVPVAASVLSKPTFAPRYGLVAAAGLLALAAAGVAALRSPFFQGGCVAMLAILAASGVGTGLVKPEWRGAGAFMNANVQAGDVVVVTRKIATYIYDYYVPRRPDVRRLGDAAAVARRPVGDLRRPVDPRGPRGLRASA